MKKIFLPVILPFLLSACGSGDAPTVTTQENLNGNEHSGDMVTNSGDPGTTGLLTIGKLESGSTFSSNELKNGFFLTGRCNQTASLITIRLNPDLDGSSPSGTIAGTTSCSNGQWKTMSAINLSSFGDGSVGFSVEMTDTANKLIYAAIRFTKDSSVLNTAPTTPSQLSIEKLGLGSAISSGEFNNGFSLRGECDASALVDVYLNSTSTGEKHLGQVSCQGSAWSFTVILKNYNFTVTDASLTFSAKVLSNGSTLLQKSLVLTQDKVAPSYSNLQFNINTGVVNSSNLTAFQASGSCTKEGSFIKILANGAVTSDGKIAGILLGQGTCTQGSFQIPSLNFSLVPLGLIILVVTVEDSAGNGGNFQSFNWQRQN